MQLNLSYQSNKASMGSYNELCEYVRNNYGINLTEAKRSLVVNRLNKRLRHTGINSLEEYYKYLFSATGSDERNRLCDFLSTNKTYFYREPAHFHFFIQLLTHWDASKELNVWSAACSSGDELYTLSILIQEHVEKYFTPLRYNLLGTDISSNVLEQAAEGIYDENHLMDLPMALRLKYFKKLNKEKTLYGVDDKLKKNTSFRKFNLIQDFGSMNQKFDIIFCRNVLIYFKDATKKKVVSRLIDQLKPGGYLVLAHCEGMLGFNMPVKQVQAGIFQKGI